MNFEKYCEKYNISLSEQQKTATLSQNGETLLLAVPGSGKTTVITARTGWLILGCKVNPEDILTITYSKAAALEMEDRFKSKFSKDIPTPKFSTINSLCVSILNYAKKTVGIKIPILEPETNRIIRAALYENTKVWPSDFLVKQLASLLTQVKNRMYSREKMQAINFTEFKQDYPNMTFIKFYELYEGYKASHNLMDFDDQLLMSLDTLTKFEDVKKHYQNMYPYISVDEAQDTSLVQFEIIKILATGGKALFLVGDDDQSIYGFRGAEPSNILNFAKFYPNAKVLYMETNYRSTSAIVDAADEFISGNVSRFKKTAKAARTEIGEITLTYKSNETTVRTATIQRIKEALKEDKTLGILCRNNSSLLPIVSILDKEGIIVKRRDDFTNFFLYPVIDQIISTLIFAHEPWNITAFKSAKKLMGLYISNSQMNKIIDEFQNSSKPEQERDLLKITEKVCSTTHYVIKAIKRCKPILKKVKNQTPSLAIQSITMGFADTINEGDTSKLNTTSIYIGILEMLAHDYNTVDSFRAKVAEYKKPHTRKKNKSNVSLSTIHASKGLEYDNVIILDAIEGILPQSETSDFETDTEEDARLFYVAVTRARNNIEFIIPDNYYGYDVTQSKYIHRLLKKISGVEDNKPSSLSLKKAEFTKNMKISHPKFGIGTVKNVENDILTISFSKFGTKKILSNFCRPL